MKYKGIIFDMDGTIIDTANIWEQTTRDIITSKATVTEEQLKDFEKKIRGLGLHPVCQIIKEEFELPHDVNDLVREKIEIAKQRFDEQVTFIEGFQKFHERALKENLVMGIATNAEDHTFEAAIKKMNLQKYFGTHLYNISYVDNIHKPAPDLYLYVAKKLNIDPAQSIAIEDSAHGIKAAVDAGMFCIGINSSKDREALERSNMIIDHYDEICLDSLLEKKKK